MNQAMPQIAKYWILAPLLVIGSFIGIACSSVPAILPFGIIAALIVLGVILRKAEVGILLIVVLVSSIIFEEVLPMIPIGVGSLQISDIILMVLLMLIIGKRLLGSASITRTPLDLPLLIFYSACVASAVISVKSFGVDFTTVIRTLRAVTYYLLFFVVTNHIKTKKQLMVLINGLFVIAVTVSIAMLVQAMIGDSISLMPGRIEKSGTFVEYDALRILPPGQTLLYIMFVTGICISNIDINRNNKLLCIIALCFTGCGVVLTYNRTYWVAIILVNIFLFFILNRYQKQRWLATIAALVLIGLIGSTFLFDSRNAVGETVLSITERFSSVFAGRKLTTSSSLDDRYTENKYAIKKIKANLVFGNGLGNSYRPDVFGSKDTLNNYIHNGYFWLLLNTGLVGFVSFFWFYTIFIARSYRCYFKIKSNKMKSILAGFLLSGLGFLPMAFLNPIFMQWYSIVVLAIIMGLNEVIIKFNNSEEYI